MSEKDFDCVKMKDDIQKKILEEVKGMTLDQQDELFEVKMSKNKILGPIWRQLKERQAKKAS